MIVAIGILLTVLWVAFTAFNAVRMISIDSRLVATTESVVGGESGFTVTVTNTGSEIKDFQIIANVEGADNWFQHHAVTDSGACTANRARGRFECGPIPSGSTRSFTIRGTATGAGRFFYILAYVDAGSGWPDRSAVKQNRWNEEVRPR